MLQRTSRFSVNLTAPGSPNSWVSSPGVIRGCAVSIDTDLRLHVDGGKLFTLNGYAADIPYILRNVAIVPPAVSASRRDLLAATVENDGLSFHYLVGDSSNYPLNQFPVLLRSGVVLAKLYVTYPTISKDSIYVYNAIPILGEGVVSNCRAMSVPDGNRLDFLFPFKCAPMYAMNINVCGVPQSENRDYTVSYVLSIDGEEHTLIHFNEPLCQGVDVSADIYCGKVALTA